MQQSHIKALIDLFGKSDLTELRYTEGNSALALSRAGSATLATAPQVIANHSTSTPVTTQATVPAAPLAIVEPAPEAKAAPTPGAPAPSAEVSSPMYGIVHLTPAPDQPPYVGVGSTVAAGQTVALIEAMKLFHEIPAPCAGVVQRILIKPGDEVDMGQVLMTIS